MVGDVIAGRYELEELIGTGGMSSVYRARDATLERRVALKLLHDQYLTDEEHVERFRREARAVAQLSHPNIVTVIDRGEDDGRHYIVFEYVEGENLKELVTREGALAVEQAVDIAIAVARGLAFAHQQGLVHRDVKPQNVLMNGDRRPKVTDFGIARSLDVERGVTQTGTVLGTSNYIAPEQASGQTISAQTDVYSFGVVLYELLTGQVPFPGENFVAVAMRHINEPPPSVLDLRPEVPVRLAGAVDRALAKDPDDRFPSMDAFVAELEACRAEIDVGGDADRTMVVPRAPRRAEPAQRIGRPTAAPSAPRRARQRSAWPLLLLLAGLAALGAVAFLVLQGGGAGGGEAERPAVAQPVRLTGVASLDPFGDDKVEHPEAVGRATDGDPETFWYTETYDDFSATKEGVGLVLDAGRPVELGTLTVTTRETPGFKALIRAGDSEAGRFTDVSPTRSVNGKTSFAISGPARRYYAVWITDLDRRAEINEVVAKSRLED